MPPSTIPQNPSYPDIIHMLSDAYVKEDVEGACRGLTHAMGESAQAFESIAKQMHTIDLQRISAPFKPRWDAAFKAYMDLLPCYRANACYILGRLKLFCTAVLPVSTRSSDRSHRSQEPAQVLQSFIGITSEHIKDTQALFEKSMALIREMVLLHIELAQLACQHFSSGQKEALELATKSSELEAQVRYLYNLNMALDISDPSYSAFTAFRLVREFGKKPSRSRITTQTLALPQNLQRISASVETLDGQRNEYAHLQYCAQIKAPPDHHLARTQASLSTLIGTTLRHFEASMLLFLSIWARIRTDCRSLAHWINSPDIECHLVSCYQQTGKTLHIPLGGLLDAYVAGLGAGAPVQA
ncbi:hypothetical protein BKA70DRAFT_1424393 [Coprinopsis sp. MPI-PUGE-AT-0042]|nr:hypothetical protein BKA70DRAFT_1424393 [Coprinopsis sp. MPI-PUGE-AT-0042]